MRKVRDTLQDGLEFLVGLRNPLLVVFDDSLFASYFFRKSGQLRLLLGRECAFLLCLLERSNFGGELVAAFLRCFEGCDERTALGIDRTKVTQNLGRVHPPEAKFFFYQAEIVTDEGEIEHGIF